MTENNTIGNGTNSQKTLSKAFYLLSPDGFTINIDAKKYTSMEAAKVDYLEWEKQFKPQGHYSSTQFGRIPINELWDKMILHTEPFYNVWN